MAVQDPLANRLPQTGEWEAQVLPKSSFDPVEYAAKWAEEQRQNRLLGKKEQDDNAALLTDDFKANWTSDNINFFQKEIDALHSKNIALYKAQNGRLTPIQKADMVQAHNNLEGKLRMNDQLLKNYEGKVKELDADMSSGKGNYKADESRKVLEMWNDPNATPELKKDIQQNYGGDINAWRAANEHKMQLVPSYDFIKHNREDVFKDVKLNKTTSNPVRDPKTGIYTATINEAPDENDLRTRAAQLVNNPNENNKSREWNSQVSKIAEGITPVTTAGTNNVVGYHSDNPAYQAAADKVFKAHGELQSASAQKDLKTEIGVAVGESLYPTKQEKQFHYPSPASGDKKDKETTTIATHYYGLGQQVEANPNMSPNQIAELFHGKAVVNTSDGTYQIHDVPLAPTTKPFAIIPMNSALTFQNGKWRPNTVTEGQVAGSPQKQVFEWKKDGKTATANTPGAHQYAQVFYNPVEGDSDSEPSSIFSNANPTVTKESYKQMLENGKKISESSKGLVKSFKVEYDLSDPVQRAFYDDMTGGNSVSQVGFNKVVKASKGKGAAPIASNNKTKETPAQRAARIASGG